MLPITKAFVDRQSFLKEIKDDDATALTNTLRLLRESKELKEGQVTAVVIFGGVSGRFDHTLDAIQSLVNHESESSLPIVLLDGENLVTVLTQPVNAVPPQRKQSYAASPNTEHLSHSVMAATSTKRSSSVPLAAPEPKKLYQPTAQNGHAGHTVSTPSKIPHQLLAAFTDRYTEYVGLSKEPVKDVFAGQFKCTYKNCQKRIGNNVAFMYHLWAHVVRFKPDYEGVVTNMHLANGARHFESAAKDDVLRLRTCPECLLVLPNPYRMQLHYHRVHKREQEHNTPELTVCNMCESVVLTENFEDHICVKHKAMGAPFWCRRCRYR